MIGCEPNEALYPSSTETTRPNPSPQSPTLLFLYQLQTLYELKGSISPAVSG